MGRWADWTNESSTNRLMFQVLSFILFIDLGHSKLFTFIFVFFLGKKMNRLKVFLQKILQEIMKKMILGTSDAWSTIHLSHQPSDRA